MDDQNTYRRAAAYRGTVPWTFEGIRTGALLRISEQLDELLALLRCPNVLRAVMALQDLAPKKKRKRRRRRRP